MGLPAICFDNQARVAPKEVGGQPLITEVKFAVDLWWRDHRALAHRQKSTLKVAAGSPGPGAQLGDDHPQAGHPATSAASPNQRLDSCEIEDAQHLGLRNFSAQLRDADHASQVQQRSGDAGAGDTSNRSSIRPVQRAIAMCGDSSRNTATTIRRRYVDRAFRVGAEPPKRRSGPMRQNGTRAAGQYGGYPSAIGSQQSPSNRVNTGMHRVEPALCDSFPDAARTQACIAKLSEGSHPVLPVRDLRNYPLSPDRLGPMGRKRDYLSRLRPIGGDAAWFVGCG